MKNIKQKLRCDHGKTKRTVKTTSSREIWVVHHLPGTTSSKRRPRSTATSSWPSNANAAPASARASSTCQTCKQAISPSQIYEVVCKCSGLLRNGSCSKGTAALVADGGGRGMVLYFTLYSRRATTHWLMLLYMLLNKKIQHGTAVR